MPHIANDQDLRNALSNLSMERQRAIGARFADSVGGAARDPKLKKVLEIAVQPESPEREDAYQTAKSITVQTYTACGRDTDWAAQAEHFVAAACVAALTPDSSVTGSANLAWKAAIQARMANNCLMMENDDAAQDNEAQRQYKITEKFSVG